MRENPGCLGAVLGLFGARSKKAVNEPLGRLPYRLRDDFLSPGELAFYRVLLQSVDTDVAILPKVNLADLFFVSEAGNSASHRNRIDRKHVDFLLCEAFTMRPLAGIELDDRSHQSPRRQERDRFVESVFETASLPLVRVPLRSSYSVPELRNALVPHVGSMRRGVEGDAEALPRAAAPVGGQLTVPTCPRCGVAMVMRTASRGARKGEQFYGCSNYPRCRETAAIE